MSGNVFLYVMLAFCMLMFDVVFMLCLNVRFYACCLCYVLCVACVCVVLCFVLCWS